MVVKHTVMANVELKMVKQIVLRLQTWPAIMLVAIVAACSFGRRPPLSLAAYDLDVPTIYKLPKALKEISGVFYNEKHKTVFAINDEEGKLFSFTLGKKEINAFKFSAHGDYEDLAIQNDTAYVLRSDGVLFSFPLADTASAVLKAGVRTFTRLPEQEYEGLYSDGDRLYVLCKHCKNNDKRNSVTGYVLQVRPAMALAGTFEIKNNDVFKPKKPISPSALAQHPITRDWYILSSAGNCMLVADSTWQARDFVFLSPDVFRQPEGITFDLYGNLYISNEGQGSVSANVLRFDFHATSPNKHHQHETINMKTQPHALATLLHQRL